jgi:hypothetical protein
VSQRLERQANPEVVLAQRIVLAGTQVSSPFGGLSDIELARAESDAAATANCLEQAITIRFDLAKAASRYGSDRMADMSALLPLYDAADAAQRALLLIRAEQSRRY